MTMDYGLWTMDSKCILGMTHCLNVFPEAGGMASTVNQVDFFWRKFIGPQKDEIEFRKTSLAFNRDSATEYTKSCVTFIQHASYILHVVIKATHGSQHNGINPNVYLGPYDTGEPTSTGLYTEKDTKMFAQMDSDYFTNLYTKGITLKRGGII